MTDRQATALGCAATLASAAVALLAIGFLGDLAAQLVRAVLR